MKAAVFHRQRDVRLEEMVEKDFGLLVDHENRHAKILVHCPE